VIIQAEQTVAKSSFCCKATNILTSAPSNDCEDTAAAVVSDARAPSSKADRFGDFTSSTFKLSASNLVVSVVIERLEKTVSWRKPKWYDKRFVLLDIPGNQPNRANWSKTSTCFYLKQGRIQCGDWGDRHPKTYDSKFIHQDFIQFRKQHSRSRPFFRPLFCHSSVVKYTSSLLL